MVENVNITGELDAMRVVGDALASLDEESRTRVLRWAVDIYGVSMSLGKGKTKLKQDNTDDEFGDEEGEGQEFGSAAELLAAASPSTDVERVLIVGYWFQELQGQEDLDSQSINTELKHQGHGVSNITKAFGGLIRQKPQLVIQLRKGGNSKQARKRYKLTIAGIKRVKIMLAGNIETE